MRHLKQAETESEENLGLGSTASDPPLNNSGNSPVVLNTREFKKCVSAAPQKLREFNMLFFYHLNFIVLDSF